MKQISAAFLLPLLLGMFLWQFVQQASTGTTSNSPTYLLLMGNPIDVQFVVDPFIAGQNLQLHRSYPNPDRYLIEAPTVYYPGTVPPGLVMELYEVTASPSTVDLIIEQLEVVALSQNVIVETDSLAWLSYLPGQFLVSGACNAISIVMGSVIGVELSAIAELEPQQSGNCGDNIQIQRYAILDEEQVVNKIATVQAMTNTIVAQPNHLIVGASRDYIAGSPLGPIQLGADPFQPTTQPYTGQAVRMAIFDTIPFNLTPGTQIITQFQGVSITVGYPITLPQDLPFGPRPLAGHGTFVTNAILDLAPNGNFHLLRVLNDTAVGDEFTWYQAMGEVISETLPVSPTLAGMVFNYSFGLEITRTASLTTTTAMSAALTAVNQHNVFQVAATGNDSRASNAPLPMTWPAQHNTTTGVTAVIWNNSGLACYANQGEVGMWGGGVSRGNTCTLDIIDDCVNGTHPEYCVVGWDPASPTRYSYGLGTSYAAPQFAAMVAQAIEEAGNGLGNWPSPSTIRNNLYSQVTTNPDPLHIQVGVINNPYPNVVSQYIYLPAVMRD